MSEKPHEYRSDAITVTYDAKRCIHFAACVRGLPRVFDPGSRPWVRPANGEPDVVADVVERCPTGALHYQRHDGGGEEAPDAANSVLVAPNGPIFLRGELELMGPYNAVRLRDTRMALCRCGQSGNKPFCDNSHLRAGFRDPAAAPGDETTEEPEGGPLRIEPSVNGPLVLRGPLRLMDGRGRVVAVMQRCILCRCGGSKEKPFCDGSHQANGFTG